MKDDEFPMSPFVESIGIRSKFFPTDTPVLVYGNEYITWEKMYDRICRLANGLVNLGIGKGDRIAFVMKNTPQFFEINFASQMIGAIPVPVNYRYTASEISYTVNDCGASCIIFEDSVREEVIQAIPNMNTIKHAITTSERSWATSHGIMDYDRIITDSSSHEMCIEQDVDDTAVIIYTGGTTGRSKGVMLSNKNILSNQESVIAHLLDALPKVDVKEDRFAKNEAERKILGAFDIFNKFFEGFFHQHGNADKLISLEVLGTENVDDKAVTMAYREDEVKLMSGIPEDDVIDVRVLVSLNQGFRSLANLLPYVYHKKGRRKLIFKLMWMLVKKQIRMKGKWKDKISLVKTLMHGLGRGDGSGESFFSLLVIPPLFHLASYAFFLMFSTYIGGTCIMPDNKHFSPKETLEYIQTHRPKWILLVPKMYRDVLTYLDSHPDHDLDLSSVYVGISGASVLRGDDKRKLIKHFPNMVVFDAFGQTEMASVASIKMDADESLVMDRSVGRVIDGVDVKLIRDDGTRCDVDGEVGEIYYRGDMVMKGYYGDMEKTKNTIDEQGWLHSGDLGFFKHGELFIVDRKGECINTGGEKVYPVEVEEILEGHDAIHHACVIGVPDEEWGNSVRAIVTLHPGKILDDGDVMEWCRGKMAGYKKPRSVIIVNEMPLSPVGKVLRKSVKQKYGSVTVGNDS